MATEKITAPADDEEDTELTSISASVRSFDEAALRRMYIEKGFTEAEADAFIAPLKTQNETNSKLLQREQRRGQQEYMNGLKEQFPYAFAADGKALFSGATKAELRRSAEAIHQHTAAIVGAVPKPDAKPAAAPADDRAAEWGSPPASAAEVVRETPDRTWESLRDTAKHAPATKGEQTKADVMADLKAHGARQMSRPRMAQMVSRQAQQAAEEAKT
jgi:hypothetical protein